MKASATSSPSGSRIASGASNAFRARNRNTETVFVYGTLRRGGSNHALLKRARYLGEFITPPVFHFFDCGDWPGVMPGGHTAIHGEVYALPAPLLRRLDVFEDYPRLYIRELMDTNWGSAWIYLLLRRPLILRYLASGDWMEKMSR